MPRHKCKTSTQRRAYPPIHRRPPKLKKAELADNYRQDARAIRIGLTHLDRALNGARQDLEQVQFLSRALSRICRHAEEQTGVRLRKHLASVPETDAELDQAREYLAQAAVGRFA